MDDQSLEQSSGTDEEMSMNHDDHQNGDLKGWRSSLLKDGLGPFLNPLRLREKVASLSIRNGLSEKCEPEALGLLMDTSEFYMRELIGKVV